MSFRCLVGYFSICWVAFVVWMDQIHSFALWGTAWFVCFQILAMRHKVTININCGGIVGACKLDNGGQPALTSVQQTAQKVPSHLSVRVSCMWTRCLLVLSRLTLSAWGMAVSWCSVAWAGVVVTMCLCLLYLPSFSRTSKAHGKSEA